jgi:hypothetical protein
MTVSKSLTILLQLVAISASALLLMAGQLLAADFAGRAMSKFMIVHPRMDTDYTDGTGHLI